MESGKITFTPNREAPDVLFEKIWEKAWEKAHKEYPDNPIKMHDILQKHILEMMALVEEPETSTKVCNAFPQESRRAPFGMLIAPFVVLGTAFLFFVHHIGFAIALVVIWILVFLFELWWE